MALSTLTSSPNRAYFKNRHGGNRIYYNVIHRKFTRYLKKVHQPELKEAETAQTQDLDFPQTCIGRRHAGKALI